MIDGRLNDPIQDLSAYVRDSINNGPGFDPGMAADEFGGLSEHQSSRGYDTMPVPSGPARTSLKPLTCCERLH